MLNQQRYPGAMWVILTLKFSLSLSMVADSPSPTLAIEFLLFFLFWCEICMTLKKKNQSLQFSGVEHVRRITLGPLWYQSMTPNGMAIFSLPTCSHHWLPSLSVIPGIHCMQIWVFSWAQKRHYACLFLWFALR